MEVPKKLMGKKRKEDEQTFAEFQSLFSFFREKPTSLRTQTYFRLSLGSAEKKRPRTRARKRFL